MIEIKSEDELGRYLREGVYYFPCNVRFSCSVVARGDIDVAGSIDTKGFLHSNGSITADRDIEAGAFIIAHGSLKAGGAINAGEHIAADEDIEAGERISADGYIKADGSITAGGDIEASRYVFSFNHQISARSIATKGLPAWRKFWAEMPPLRKWREEILNLDLCWKDYKLLLTQKEARKVCAWGGWNWIFRGQLECFFGFEESFQPPK